MDLNFAFNWLTYTTQHGTPFPGTKNLSALISVSQKQKEKKHLTPSIRHSQGIQRVVS